MGAGTYSNELSSTNIPFDEDHTYPPEWQTSPIFHSADLELADVVQDDNHLYRRNSSAIDYKMSTIGTLPKLYPLGCFSQSASNIAKRRGFHFNLPPFTVATEPVQDEPYALEDRVVPLDQQHFALVENCRLPSIDSERPLQTIRSRSVGPLTPPEDADVPSWLASSVSQAGCTDSLSSEVNGSHLEVDPTPGENSGNNTNRPSINLPQNILQRESSQDPAYPAWLRRALDIASSSFSRTAPYCSKEIISQVLPAHASDQRSTKTYELVCDYLDGVLANPEFTVTHVLAVEKASGLKDFPKSPPSTPSFSNRQSYFEDDFEPRIEHQNMFTNIARVPLYHQHLGERTSSLAKTQRNVMAAKADLIVVERYIPPISDTALKDFFDADSGRSYLADRMHELSLDGSLILIYPLTDGGRTFQKKYIGPIIDPIVLEMTITRGLTASVAETIATMSAVDSMLDIDEMKARIDKMGEVVAARSGPRLPANEFTITHSEKADIILDQDTWKTWFLDQEQSRIRDDIIQYHKEGGRLPDALGRNEEVTASIIAREIRDGFQNSRKETGNVPIEVGVFVIRRTRK